MLWWVFLNCEKHSMGNVPNILCPRCKNLFNFKCNVKCNFKYKSLYYCWTELKRNLFEDLELYFKYKSKTLLYSSTSSLRVSQVALLVHLLILFFIAIDSKALSILKHPLHPLQTYITLYFTLVAFSLSLLFLVSLTSVCLKDWT